MVNALTMAAFSTKNPISEINPRAIYSLRDIQPLSPTTQTKFLTCSILACIQATINSLRHSSMTPYRKISMIERSYILHDKSDPSEFMRMAINLTYEGEGSFDLQRWNDALEQVGQKHPGSRLVKRGHLGWTKWMDSGVAPKARLIDFSHWDGVGSEGAEIFTSPLPVINGPSFEVLLLEGNPLRVCFRCHHAVMDAVGAMTFAKDTFRALRGEPIIGSNSTISDIELMKTINGGILKQTKSNAVAPTGFTSGNDLESSWRLLRVHGKQKGLIAKIALATRQSALRYKDQQPVPTKTNQPPLVERISRSRITVDLRRHLPNDIISTANLSSAFHIEVDEQDSVKSVTAKIKTGLDEKQECALPAPILLKLAPWLPSRLAGLSDKNIQAIHRRGRYVRSGTLSNMGIINRAEVSGGGFNTRSGFGVPIQFKLTPYFITFMGDEDGCNIMISVPNCLGDNGRLDQFTADIEQILTA